MIKLTLDQLRYCTCKKHYEERCKILYDQGKLICWTAGHEFKDPNHCIVCQEESLEKLREANKQINQKRLFLIHALDAAWYYISIPIADFEAKERALENYMEYKERFKKEA